MARYGFPDDQDDYPASEPTQYADFGGGGAQAYSEYPPPAGHQAPSPGYEYPAPAAPPWHHRPAVLVGLGALTAAMLALLVYAVVSFTNSGNTQRPAGTPSSTSPATSPAPASSSASPSRPTTAEPSASTAAPPPATSTSTATTTVTATTTTQTQEPSTTTSVSTSTTTVTETTTRPVFTLPTLPLRPTPREQAPGG